MSVHKFPLPYVIYGKEAGKQKEIYKTIFENINLHVKEVDVGETQLIGNIKRGDATAEILFYDNNYYVKNKIESEEQFKMYVASRAIARNENKLELDNAFILSNFHEDDQKKWRDDIVVSSEDTIIKRVTTSKKDEALIKMQNNVEDNLIEVNGELYLKTGEPTYLVTATKNVVANQVVNVFVSFESVKQLEWEEERFDREDDQIHFAFDDKDSLNILLDKLRLNYNLNPQIRVDGEYYYGGKDFYDFTNKNKKVLENSALFVVDEAGYMKEWPVVQLNAWGNLRDALKILKASSREVEDYQKLIEAMKLYNGIEQHGTWAIGSNYETSNGNFPALGLVALETWELKNTHIDLDAAFDIDIDSLSDNTVKI